MSGPDAGNDLPGTSAGKDRAKKLGAWQQLERISNPDCLQIVVTTASTWMQSLPCFVTSF